MAPKPEKKPGGGGDTPSSSRGPVKTMASGAARPAGTDGSDHAYRQTVDERACPGLLVLWTRGLSCCSPTTPAGYKHTADARSRLTAACGFQMQLGFIALVWGLLVPWLVGRTMAQPLPVATAATAILCSSYGIKLAGGVTNAGRLERYQKMTRSALFVCTLTLGLPRVSGVPPNPAVNVVARLAARWLGVTREKALPLARGFDTALDCALGCAALRSWSRARGLRRAMEAPRQLKPREKLT
jgi:hypothetical protein